MTWIMLWVFSLGQGSGNATAEFNTLDACEYAVAQADKMEGIMGVSKAVCVPKGDNQ